MVIPEELKDRQMPYAVPMDSCECTRRGMEAMNGICSHHIRSKSQVAWREIAYCITG